MSRAKGREVEPFSKGQKKHDLASVKKRGKSRQGVDVRKEKCAAEQCDEADSIVDGSGAESSGEGESEEGSEIPGSSAGSEGEFEDENDESTSSDGDDDSSEFVDDGVFDDENDLEGMMARADALEDLQHNGSDDEDELYDMLYSTGV